MEKSKDLIPLLYTLLILSFLLVSFVGSAKSEGVIYTGVNGKLVNEEEAIRKKELKSLTGKRMIVTTYTKSEDKWQKQYRERIRTVDTYVYRIRARGTGISETFIRRYEKVSEGLYRFTDFKDDIRIKTGYTQSLFPLIFHGEIVEYYENGQRRSVSIYDNNELVSNQNWLANGEEYINNIFYSVDVEPMFPGGMARMHQHVRQSFASSGLDITTLSGTILLGFVVMEDGSIGGVRVLNGISPGVNSIADKSLNTLEGKWTPARLNNKSVRFFQLFPINFIHQQNRFESVEFNGTMLHWEIY
jgi:antitoxin component YwqK of YwqJK toxin-antitoxin module